jgi:ribosomal protein S7
MKAFKLLLEAFIFLKLKTKRSPLRQFYKVCLKIRPFVILKNIKLGSTKYLVPTPLPKLRQLLLGLEF